MHRKPKWLFVGRSNWKLPLGLMSALLMVGVLIPTLAYARQDELADVRQVTAQFHRVEAAEAAGYKLGYLTGDGRTIITGCVAHPTDPTAGAMGFHYFNKALIDDMVADVLKPEGLVYAPASNGELKLVAVEYVVPGPNSNPRGPAETPSVLGRPMHILVPAVGFWILHAWVWSHNPTDMFSDWNPEVTCA